MNADWKRAIDKWEMLWGEHKISVRPVSEVKNNELWILNKNGITVYPCEEIKQGENKMRSGKMEKLAEERLREVIDAPECSPHTAIDDDVWPTYHQVKIDKATNGFIVEIGCKKFVAEDWKSLASKLGEYWRDPVAAEKKYCGGK